MSNLYHEKRSVFQAVQLNWANWSDICHLLGAKIGEHNPGVFTGNYNSTCGEEGPYIKLNIPQPNNTTATALHGDWIVKDESGNVTVYTDSAFEKRFEPAQ